MKILYLLFCTLMSCNGVENSISPKKIIPFLQRENLFEIVSSEPANATVSVKKESVVRILFNRPIQFSSCIKAFSILPSVRGQFKEIPLGLEFSPESDWDSGTYSITITKNCEDLEGNDLKDAFSFYFTGEELPDPLPPPTPIIPKIPVVQAFGLESQGCADTYPGIGSSSGGDWTSPHCFWDHTLPILAPSAYRFRGGDLGTGSVGSSLSCEDSPTDNFQILFSEYMDPVSTPQGVRLRRHSPPASTILLSSWIWKDCSVESSGGCRVLVLRFSEMESTCNGSLFGNGSTGGDFNLQSTAGYPSGYGIYTLFLDSQFVKASTGQKLNSDFYFSMEGK